MRIVGADLSITSTGLALLDGGSLVDQWNMKTKGKRGDGYPEWAKRIGAVSVAVLTRLTDWDAGDSLHLLVIEAPSHGSRFGNPHERAALWWDVYRWAYRKTLPVTTVAPRTRAKFLTGSGKADKAEVLSRARLTYPDWEIPNDDIADAIGLADMAANVFGESKAVGLTPKQLETLEVPTWPLCRTLSPSA